MARHISSVDSVYEYNYKTKEKSIWALIKNIQQLRSKEKIEKIYILNDTFRTALYGFLTGAKERIGRKYQSRDFLLTQKIDYVFIDHHLHMSDFLFGVLNNTSVHIDDFPVELVTIKEDDLFVDDLLDGCNTQCKKILAINPCSADIKKDWSIEETAEFIKLIKTKTDYQVAIIGNTETQDFANSVKYLTNEEFLDLTGKTSLSQLLSLIKKVNILVSVDTGTAHLSYALKTPTITLFFQENMYRWDPKNLDDNLVIYDKSGISAQTCFAKIQNKFHISNKH